MSAIETIASPHDFKVACDGLLRFELGPHVQTYGGDGPDAGIDAEFSGPLGKVTGRWVFQFKFSSPWDGRTQRRGALLSKYLGKKSEFDKPGVKGAVGYVLMTNVPITVGMVSRLRAAWRKRRRSAPLLVWDPTRLNALLKEHPSLARSWSGIREARCHQVIVMPLWSWLQEHARPALWQEEPLWPIEPASTNVPIPVPQFRVGYEVTYRLVLGVGPRVAPLYQLAQDPRFRYASSTAYPRALARYAAARSAVERLANVIMAELTQYAKHVVENIQRVAAIADLTRREDIASVLAYCILEVRWGFPRRWAHDVIDDRLMVCGGITAWQEPGLSEIRPMLNALIAEGGRGAIPPAIQRARDNVFTELNRLAERLWDAVDIGVDAEPEGPEDGEE